MSVRRMLDKPMVLDESVISLEAMLEIHRLGAADDRSSRNVAAARCDSEASR